jgi:hypothetical protein
MALTFTDGNITTDGTEQTLWDVTADKHFAGWVFTDNMTGAETISIKVWVQDTNDSATLKKYIDTEITGAQGTPAFFIPYVPNKQHKVTIQRTAGSDVVYYWQRAEA